MSSPTVAEEVRRLARQFRLPTIADELATRLLAAGHEDALQVVHEVFVAEADDRLERRVTRLRQQSRLPPGKTFDSLDDTKLPRVLATKLRKLASGAFLDGAVNILAFGLPGTGKTHAAAALGHALVAKGHKVLFAPTPSVWFRTSSPQSAISSSLAHCASSTPTSCSSSTTSGTSSRTPTRSKFSSPSWPSATSAARC